jgi:hypothetical protein
MSFQSTIQAYAEEPLSTQVLVSLLKEYKRPYDKIAELVKQGQLTPIKNGLYISGPKLQVRRPETFLIANHIWGPSYISLESALSHWGYIPERVYEVSSVTLKRSRRYKTEVGRFSFMHVPLPYYSFGIQRIQLTPKQAILMARPEKAVCDKIVMTPGVLLRSVPQVLRFLTEDLRIDEDMLTNLSIQTIDSWIADAPKSTSLQMLVKTLETL